jgi:small subunit ribosomal protein S6
MNRYEMGVVVRADLEEEVFRAEMERVKGFIDRFGGTIDKIDEWGRRKLAYPIAKLNEGIYTFITYSSEGSTPKEVEARLRLQENILRFLTIRVDETLPLTPAQSAPSQSETAQSVQAEESEVVEAPSAPAQSTSAQSASTEEVQA